MKSDRVCRGMVDVIQKLQAAAQEASAKAAAAEAGTLSTQEAEEAADEDVLAAEVRVVLSPTLLLLQLACLPAQAAYEDASLHHAGLHQQA